MGNRKTGLLWAAVGVGAAYALRATIRKRRLFSFQGKTVLITGGSRGLGLEMARLFAAEGARLALAARDLDELNRAKAQLQALGAEVFILPIDVTQREEIEQSIHAVQERLGAVDVLVNNAGVIEVGPMEEMTLEDYEEALRTHFWAPLYATLAVLPEMRQRRSGRIVNIASIGGKISVPHMLPYSASKFALIGLSEGLRAELLQDNIYVTTVCPGLMRTGSHVNAKFKGQHRVEATLFSLGASLPLASINAESAARSILLACRQGDPEVVLSVPAKLGATLHGLFPGLTADLCGQVNRYLPQAGGIGQEHALGKDSQTAISPSILTALGDKAARRNNELG